MSWAVQRVKEHECVWYVTKHKEMQYCRKCGGLRFWEGESELDYDEEEICPVGLAKCTKDDCDLYHIDFEDGEWVACISDGDGAERGFIAAEDFLDENSSLLDTAPIWYMPLSSEKRMMASKPKRAKEQ